MLSGDLKLRYSLKAEIYQAGNVRLLTINKFPCSLICVTEHKGWKKYCRPYI
jgi:hypothetical protein